MKSNEQLRQDVQDELEWEPSLDAAGIGVSVHDGVVTLNGHVRSYGERSVAEKAAKRVYGVHAIANELVVELPGARKRDDTDIAEAAVRALRWHTSIPEDRVKVVVANGWVRIEGEVEWFYQKQAAYDAIRHLTGVVGVANDITIKPLANPVQVKEKIEDALRRGAELDAKQITVEVHDGRVILRGTVRSWAEREDAESAAWAAPGVSNLESHIRVEEEELVAYR